MTGWERQVHGRRARLPGLRVRGKRRQAEALTPRPGGTTRCSGTYTRGRRDSRRSPGGGEYKSAETYFGRLRVLNPEDGARGDLRARGAKARRSCSARSSKAVSSGWGVSKPPDMCSPSSQAGAVGRLAPPEDARCALRQSEPSTGSGRTGDTSSADASGVDPEGSNMGADSARLSFIERLREGHYANEQIERVYGELRGIESASRGRAFRLRSGERRAPRASRRRQDRGRRGCSEKRSAFSKKKEQIEARQTRKGRSRGSSLSMKGSTRSPIT